MNEATLRTPAKWHTCVSTMKCDTIKDYVSIMVKNDWTPVCTWYRQNKEAISGDKKRGRPDRKVREKIPLCQGPLCSYVTGYLDRLMKEEQAMKS